MSGSYDTIVIGAGIVGCCVAYTLKQKGQKVLLVDRSSVAASGGSGAAGAFVSPKIGKGSALQTLTNEAFEFSKDFYLNHFPNHFYQTGVIRIPKDADDAEKFPIYEEHNKSKHRWVEKKELEELGIYNCEKSFLFDESAVCDAPEMCREIMHGLEFKQVDVDSLKYSDDFWHIETSSNPPRGSDAFCKKDSHTTLSDYDKQIDLKAKNIVLSTGYENKLFDMRYMAVKGTWGSRGDYESSLDLKVSMHKSISISSNINGVIKVGASHVKAKKPCVICDGEPLKEIFEKATTMVDTSDFKLKETLCGMRAGSKDYFPLAGKVIDVPFMLETYPKITQGAKPEFKHIENLFICNGVGGRGFVFSPYIAELLAESIVKNEPIDKRINPDRLFLKWCRKLCCPPTTPSRGR